MVCYEPLECFEYLGLQAVRWVANYRSRFTSFCAAAQYARLATGLGPGVWSLPVERDSTPGIILHLLDCTLSSVLCSFMIFLILQFF